MATKRRQKLWFVTKNGRAITDAFATEVGDVTYAQGFTGRDDAVRTMGAMLAAGAKGLDVERFSLSAPKKVKRTPSAKAAK